jgi:hypothetical protein
MAEPWFDPNHWAWLPGTVLGCLCGLWGSLAGTLVPRGQGRVAVYGVGFLAAALATGCVIAGLIGLMSGQPFAVWFFLVVPLLPIDIMLVVFLCLLPRFYQRAEENARGMNGNMV